MPNYQQPDFRVLATPPGVGVQLENNKNVLGISGAQTAFSQPGVSARALLVDQLKGTYMGNSKRTNLDGTSTST